MGKYKILYFSIYNEMYEMQEQTQKLQRELALTSFALLRMQAMAEEEYLAYGKETHG